MTKPKVSQKTRIKKRNPSKHNKIMNNIKVKNKTNIRKKNVKYTQVKPIFKNETVFIIGGGPSLKGFNWSSLKNKNTIAINKAYTVAPWSKVFYWTDSRFYKWYKNDIDKLNGLKYTINYNNVYKNDIKVLKKGKKHGLEINNTTIAHGDNSGCAAINLAYHLGATKIVLLGFDLDFNKDTHFHDGYPVNPTSKKIYKNRFFVSFRYISKELEKKNIKVLNASETSILDCFEKITHEEALTL